MDSGQDTAAPTVPSAQPPRATQAELLLLLEQATLLKERRRQLESTRQHMTRQLLDAIAQLLLPRNFNAPPDAAKSGSDRFPDYFEREAAMRAQVQDAVARALNEKKTLLRAQAREAQFGPRFHGIAEIEAQNAEKRHRLVVEQRALSIREEVLREEAVSLIRRRRAEVDLLNLLHHQATEAASRWLEADVPEHCRDSHSIAMYIAELRSRVEVCKQHERRLLYLLDSKQGAIRKSLQQRGEELMGRLAVAQSSLQAVRGPSERNCCDATTARPLDSRASYSSSLDGYSSPTGAKGHATMDFSDSPLLLRTGRR